jgi:hypothetical protein
MLAVTPSESREVALIANPKFEVGLGAGHRARRLIDGADPAFSDPFLLMAEDWAPRDTFGTVGRTLASFFSSSQFDDVGV